MSETFMVRARTIKRIIKDTISQLGTRITEENIK